MKKQQQKKDRVSELKSHIGFWLRFASNHVSTAFAKALGDSGVTVAEWVILREMYNTEETSPSIVAEATGMTRGAASKLVDRLVDKSLATRREHSEDRRYQQLALTEAGRRLVPQLAAIADSNDQAFFAPLTKAERETLVVILRKLVDAHNLQKVPTE